MQIQLYGVIVLSGVASGFVSACILSHLSGLKKQTVFYTAFLNLFCTLMFSILSVILFSGGREYGLSGLGAAFGLMLGTLISSYIHGDHPRELVSSWIVSAPLMYGVSKLACSYAGCCSGKIFSLPIQPVVSATFILIYIISVIVFIKSKDKMKASYLAMIISFVARAGLDFFHDSHVGRIITREQILVLIAGSIAFGVYIFRSKLPLPKG